MPVYAKLFILFLFISIAGNAQSDTLLAKTKTPKVDIGIIPFTIYYAPQYFSKTNYFYFVYGLQFKYYLNAKNAIRTSFMLNKVTSGASSIPITQYDNTQAIKQYSVGFQHTFFIHKKISTY